MGRRVGSSCGIQELPRTNGERCLRIARICSLAFVRRARSRNRNVAGRGPYGRRREARESLGQRRTDSSSTLRGPGLCSDDSQGASAFDLASCVGMLGRSLCVGTGQNEKTNSPSNKQ